MASSANKTTVTEIRVEDYVNTTVPDERRHEVRQLIDLFAATTGWQPRMWGPSIIGFGSYRYRYDSGREGETCATGFSPRKGEYALYLHLGDLAEAKELAGLGKHKIGKGCLYIKHLSDVDGQHLRKLIALGLENLRQTWPVSAS